MNDNDFFGKMTDLNKDVDAKVMFIHLAALDQMVVDEENKKRRRAVKKVKFGEIADDDLEYLSSA